MAFEKLKKKYKSNYLIYYNYYVLFYKSNINLTSFHNTKVYTRMLQRNLVICKKFKFMKEILSLHNFKKLILKVFVF